MLNIVFINLTINCASLFILFMLLIGTILGGSRQEKTTKWFKILLAVTMVAVVAELVMEGLHGTPGKAAGIAVRIASYAGYLSWAMQGLGLAGYLYEYISTKTVISKKPFVVMAALSGFSAIIFTAEQFLHVFGGFDEYNRYQPSSAFWMSMIMPVITLTIYSVIVVRSRNVLKPREWLSFLFYTLIFVVMYIISYFNPSLWIAYLGNAVAMFMVYINIQVELTQQLAEQRVQLEENRTAIMLSQIQPHFLYNSLTAISGQCKDNPQAQQAVVTFAKYLRVNMDSLNEKNLILFENELEHTQMYLWLEKLRFGDKLNIEYNINTMDFMLPVLSLQPIVENAVRHGLFCKPDGGSIVISTNETKHSYDITVCDDGEGFEQEALKKDGCSHLGIDNVRTRLQAMCGGQLDIESTPGEGTTATIIIPKKYK